MSTLAQTKYRVSLDEVAESMGVSVRIAPTPGNYWGFYDHPHRLVTIKPGLGLAQHRSTLAHELGHAHYNHHGHADLKHEHLADKWAAKMLLTQEDILEHTHATMDWGEAAARCEVMPWVIKAFIRTMSHAELSLMLDMLESRAA